MEKVMENTTYANGGEPQVGDIITVARNNEFSYNSQLRREYSRNYTTKFEVLGVSAGTKSTLLTIKEVGSSYYYSFNTPMKCSNFDLYKSADAETIESKGPPKYMVVQHNRFQSFFLARSDEELHEKLGKMLQENPMRKYHVYSYTSTAQTEKPQIQMVNLSK